MGTEGHEHAEKIKCFSEVWGVSTVWQRLFALLKNTAKFSVLCGWQEESVILVSSPPSPPTPTRVLWRWACTACREAAIPECPLRQLAWDELGAVAAACWSHFLLLWSGVGSGSPRTSSVFVLGHWCSHGFSALFSRRQSRLALQFRHLFCILWSWAACTLLFLRSLHALPSFLLAKGIALSERKVLRAEWNLPENALLFRVRRMEVGVGQKLNTTVGRAERTRTARRRRERYGSSEMRWGVSRRTGGSAHPSGGRRGLLFSGNCAARPKALEAF